jgi:uncharacterized protein (DUF1800 family)
LKAPPPISQTRRDFFGGVWAAAANGLPRARTPQVAFATVPAPSHWTDVKLRLLRRATLGLTSADVTDIRAMGYQGWLDSQLHYESIDDSAMDAVIASKYPPLSMTAVQLAATDSFTVAINIQDATIERAAFSKRQLYERMVEFWSDHFNIAMSKVGYLKVIDDREVIRKHALGKFSDLLKASAHSPAMLAYLDQAASRVGAPNQNYVRELMELHTLGVDGGYTQTDVDELARVFTGWAYTGAGDFVFKSGAHDYAQKTVLGVTIPATPGSGPGVDVNAAIQEGERMLDVLLNHPSTARFIATKMLKWLLTPEPTAAQVSAIATVYRATKGDIRLMVRAILNQAWVGAAPMKFKRPFHYFVSALRATQPPVALLANTRAYPDNMGQRLFAFETPDGYPDAIEYWCGNMPPRWSQASILLEARPEWINTGPYLATSPAAAIDKMQTDFFGDELSLATRLRLLNFLNAGPFDDARVRVTIALALSSAEFQWY